VAILGRAPLCALLCGALLAVCLRGARGAEAPTEYQVKAVFVYNFSRFVEWPSQAFTAPNEPFVIGILGSDPFGARLDEAVRGEQIDQHPLVVRRFRNLGEIADCRILYIDRSESAKVQEMALVTAHAKVPAGGASHAANANLGARAAAAIPARSRRHR